MKVVVDELPKSPEECLFCLGRFNEVSPDFDYYDNVYECGFRDGIHKHIACCLALHGYCNCLVENKKEG